MALKARQDSVAKRLDLVAGIQSDKQAVDRLKSLNASLNEKLAALDGVVDTRLKLTGQGEAIVKSARRHPGEGQQVLLPSVEKAQGDITVVSMTLSGEATQSTMTLLRSYRAMCRCRRVSAIFSGWSIWPPACSTARRWRRPRRTSCA